MIPDEIVTGDREAKRLLCYAAAPEGPLGLLARRPTGTKWWKANMHWMTQGPSSSAIARCFVSSEFGCAILWGINYS